MTHLRNDYANTLGEMRFLYVPSCMIVEMLTKLYGQVATINLSGSLHNVTPDLLILLRRMQRNIRATADAYGEKRIRFLIGDWRDDKLRARKLFFNIMSRLGYISELLEKVERNMLFAAIEEMTSEWTALDRLIDSTSEERNAGDVHGVCGSFRNCNSERWRQSMSNTILALADSPEAEDVDYLLLLCYGRVKLRLVSALAEAERRSGAKHLDPDRIFAVSKDNIPITCPKCSGSCSDPGSASARGGTCPIRGTSRISLKKSSDAKAAHFKRSIMPPSLATLGSPGRP